MTNIFCQPMPESKLESKRLVCFDKMQNPVCTIYCDGSLKAVARTLYPAEMRQLSVIQNNFDLFYDNLVAAEAGWEEVGDVYVVEGGPLPED